MRILAIKAIFDPKNPFLTNSIDDRIKIKAEITNFIMRYYMNLIKLRPSKKHVVRGCRCGGILGCGVADAAHCC